jgi:hypothetical protein
MAYKYRFSKFSAVAFYMCVGKATTVFVMCNFLYGNDCTFTVEIRIAILMFLHPI